MWTHQDVAKKQVINNVSHCFEKSGVEEQDFHITPGFGNSVGASVTKLSIQSGYSQVLSKQRK